MPASWEDPTQAVDAIAGATATLLALARERGFRLYVAASSEVFGDAGEREYRVSILTIGVIQNRSARTALLTSAPSSFASEATRHHAEVGDERGVAA